MQLNNKGLLIVLDGLGDHAIAAFGGQTPLEAANTPWLDNQARDGICGLVDPLIPGMPVDTHTGTGALLGSSPRDLYHLSRGPVEAAGTGISIRPGNVALRCNFATLDADGARILDRRAGRIQDGTGELALALNDIQIEQEITATLNAATQHRAVLVLSGPGLSADISDTDPGTGHLPARLRTSQPLRNNDEEATRTAHALNRFIGVAFDRLSDHPVNRRRIAKNQLPANCIITRGAGMSHRIENLIRHIGLKTAVISGERTVLGLARLLNFSAISDPRFTSLPDTNLEAKLGAARDAMKNHDLVMLHIKGTDICSHDLDPEGKKEFIERIDRSLQSLVSDELVIGVSADHSTDSNTGSHCGDPVPTLLNAPLGRKDSCTRFGESSCMNGGLGRISATAFITSMLDAMGALQNYRPADRRFFRTR